MADQRTIGYITQSFPGLTTTFIYREVFGLRAAGFDVATFSIRRPDINLLSKESQGLVTSTHYAFPIRIQRLVFSHLAALAENPSCYLGTLFFLLTRPGESPSNRRRTFFHFMEAIYLLPKAKEEGIRHIHAHFCVNAATVALVLSRMLGISFSFTIHNNLFTDRILLREKAREAKFIISISEFSKQYLLDLYPGDPIADKIKIVHCGVDPDSFTPANLDRGPGTPLIYSVSQIAERKGYPVLVEACRILKDRGAHFYCIIDGDGPDLAELKDQVSNLGLDDCVACRGRIFQEDLPAQLDEADVFVLPCITARNGDMDGVPVVLMEAMAKAIPCVSTKVSGIPELIQEGEGILVDEKDAPALADAIESCLESPDLRRRLGLAGREKVRSQYNIHSNVEQLCAFFLRSLDG